MSRQTDKLKSEVDASREELLQTAMELGNRIDIPRTTFIVGVFTGIMLLAMLNRIQFRRAKK